MALIRGGSRSRDEILAAQAKGLRSLVRHASSCVPYYQRLFAGAGLRPDDVRTLDDLSRIPLTSKADLHVLPASEVVARGLDLDSLVVHRTSGSTAEPATIRRTAWEERLLLASRLQTLLRGGLRWTDRRAFVGFFPPGHLGPETPGTRFFSRLGLLRQREIHSLVPAEQIIAELLKAQPDVLIGYPTALSWVAEQAEPKDLAAIRPRFVVTGAETLTPDLRRRISEGFRAPVYDQYGSHEFVFIAWECPETGLYHVCDNSLIVEVLRDGRPVGEGETGELVGTALHSYAMPFIRYRLGDVVTRGPASCPCGAPFSTLSKIQGRLIDRFPMPDGSSIHPFQIEVLLEGQGWIRRFQIIHTPPQLFRISVVARDAPVTEQVHTIEGLLRESLGPDVQVKIDLVDQIPPSSASGKFYPYLQMDRQRALAGDVGTVR